MKEVEDVSDIFWEFCKAAAKARTLDEFRSSPEYEEMNAAIGSGRRLAIGVFPPLRRLPPARLPHGCEWCADSELYTFDGVNELFYGVREILDPHAATHVAVLEKWIARINAHIDAEDLADDLVKHFKSGGQGQGLPPPEG